MAFIFVEFKSILIQSGVFIKQKTPSSFFPFKPYIHLHAALAGQDHVIHGGHVLEMRVGATCEMFVTVLDGEVERQKDEALRINLWRF